MAIATFPIKLFEKEIGKLDEATQEAISMFGTPVEEINENEGSIAIEVFPNRPDLLSFQGFKRAFLAYRGKKTGLATYKLEKPKKDYAVTIEKAVESVRPYTACAIIKNLTLNDDRIKELIDMQEKLHLTLGRKRKKLAIGIYPLEKITLPIRYTAKEPDQIKFTPLEAEREMSGIQILQRHPTGRDYAHLLAGKERFPIFLDAKDQILSMPPIINAHHTGKVDLNTKEVFVECSGFDKQLLAKCLNIIVTTFLDMSPKVEAHQMKITYESGEKSELTPNLKPEKMKLDPNYAKKMLGFELTDKQLKSLLEKMGYDCNTNSMTVEIPAWRTDILHEIDLVEDIAIAYGYDNIKPILPDIATVGTESADHIFKRKLAQILVGAKLLEVSNYHLTTVKDQFEKMSDHTKQKEHKAIKVLDSKTEYTILREDLTHYLIKNCAKNVDAEYPQEIFEVGKVFKQVTEEEITEEEHLAFAITPGNYTQAKQLLEYLSREADIALTIEEPEEVPAHFISGRVGVIKYKEEPIGHLGEVHPRILKNAKLKMPLAIAEINLQPLIQNTL